MPPRSRFRQAFCRTLAIALSVASLAYPQADDAVTAEARSLYHQGRADLAAGRPEAARLVLERAYELRPVPKVGFALGLAELGMGLFVPAAEHMMLYMRQEPNPTQTERKAFAEAERNVAHLWFDVNIDRAHIYMDGQPLGDTPFVYQPVYVIAGRHEVRAECEGFNTVMQTYDVVAGHRTDVKIVLERRHPAPSGSVTGAPVPTPTVPPPPIQPPTKDPPKRFSLDTRTVVIGSGAVLTVAAGVLAIVEAGRAASIRSDIDAVSIGGAYACFDGRMPECARIQEYHRDRHSAIDIMRGAEIGVAVFGAATVAAWLWWPHAKSVQITPQMGQSMTGLTISGALQ